MKSVSRSRLGKGQSWNSNPGLSSSPGLTLETVLATVTVLHHSIERKQDSERKESSLGHTDEKRLAKSGPKCFTPRAVSASASQNYIIHPLIPLSSQLFGAPGVGQVLLQKYFCFDGGGGVPVFVGDPRS